MGEVIQFPDRKKQVANDNHMPDIDTIVDQSKDLQERSEALLRWAKEMLNEDKD